MCFSCGKPPHNGTTCEEFNTDEGNKKAFIQELVEAGQSEYYGLCPNCRNLVSRVLPQEETKEFTAGCPWMTCGQNAADKDPILFNGALAAGKGCGNRFHWNNRIQLSDYLRFHGRSKEAEETKMGREEPAQATPQTPRAAGGPDPEPARGEAAGHAQPVPPTNPVAAPGPNTDQNYVWSEHLEVPGKHLYAQPQNLAGMTQEQAQQRIHALIGRMIPVVGGRFARVINAGEPAVIQEVLGFEMQEEVVTQRQYEELFGYYGIEPLRAWIRVYVLEEFVVNMIGDDLLC